MLFPKPTFEFIAIPAVQYPRGGVAAKFGFFGIVESHLFSRQQLKRVNADFAVLGVGGYISAPPVLAAWTLGIHAPSTRRM